MFSPENRELRWSGSFTNRRDLPQPSPEAPDIRSCGICFARLVGKFTHRGTGHNCPRILPDVKQTGGPGGRAVPRHCMCQPWLTTSNCPVNASEGNAAKKT